jgi:hypothetical protein
MYVRPEGCSTHNHSLIYFVVVAWCAVQKLSHSRRCGLRNILVYYDHHIVPFLKPIAVCIVSPDMTAAASSMRSCLF